MRLIGLVASLFFLSPAFAETSKSVTNNIKTEIPYKRIQPCDWWRATSTGYVCSHLPRDIDVVQATDVDTLIKALEQKIEALEARVAELEQ